MRAVDGTWPDRGAVATSGCAAVAKRLGISQPDVSRLLKGQFRDVSVERLIRLLTRLGCDVDIVIRDHGKAASARDTIHLQAVTQ